MILFQTIRWKNLLSTGNVYTEIDLTKSPTTLIVGENGAGKSTILDALCFVLYGKPFRKIKKDQLVNSINNKDMVVEINFRAYNRDYRIVRGIKPTLFEIYQDGNLINQSASIKDYQEVLDKSILKMNMKAFTQIVILGSSSFVPFMQLSPTIRREVLEDLLDIRVFTTMASILKDKVSDLKQENALIEKDIKSTNDLLRVHAANKNKRLQDTAKVRADLELQIGVLDCSIITCVDRIRKFQDDIDTMLRDISDVAQVSEKQNEVANIRSSLTSKMRNAEKSIAFYTDNDHCPTCTQSISEDIRISKVKEKQDQIQSIQSGMVKLEEQAVSMAARLSEISSITQKIESLQDKIRNKLKPQIVVDTREMERLKKQLTDLDNVVDEIDETPQLTQKLVELHEEQKRLLGQRDIHDITSVLLKDTGIKSKIVKQYIPIINTFVNKYLASMEFFVKFELNENFEERILSRHRDEFSYDSFSEGEKMRIDLALLFTWRAIARMKNSASTNLLILDEVFDASLDTTGCDEFLKLLTDLENANVFVISHKKESLQDKFRSSIRFEKHNNFSRIAK